MQHLYLQHLLQHKKTVSRSHRKKTLPSLGIRKIEPGLGKIRPPAKRWLVPRPVAVQLNYQFATRRGERHHSLRIVSTITSSSRRWTGRLTSGAPPGAWEWRPPRGLAKNARVSVMVWEGLRFSFCCKFESVYDKNFTNQSAPILSLSFSPPRGGYNSQTIAPPAPFDAVAVDDIIHRLSPTDWRGVGIRNDPLVSVMEKAQVMWSFHDAYQFFSFTDSFLYIVSNLFILSCFVWFLGTCTFCFVCFRHGLFSHYYEYFRMTCF